MIDARAFGLELAGIVKSQLSPVIARLSALEAQIASLPVPKDGADADEDAITAVVVERTRADMDALRKSVDGIVTLSRDDVASMIAAVPAVGPDGMDDRIHAAATKAVQDVLAAQPSPEPALRQADVDAAIEAAEGRAKAQADAAIAAAIAAMPVPQDGKDADPDAVAEIVLGGIKGDVDAAKEAAEVARTQVAEVLAMVDDRATAAAEAAVKALPVPQDGKSVTVEDVSPMVQEAVSKAVAAIPPAKDGADGVGLAGAFIDRIGNLAITLTNGEVKNLGQVVGKDGDRGENGADGLGFEDMDFEDRDGRKYAVFRRGDRVKEVRLPGISYRGVWKAGDYLPGDNVTYGGAQWIALQDTSEKPGESKSWQLAVRKPRDGRDATTKPDPVKIGGGDAG